MVFVSVPNQTRFWKSTKRSRGRVFSHGTAHSLISTASLPKTISLPAKLKNNDSNRIAIGIFIFKASMRGILPFILENNDCLYTAQWRPPRRPALRGQFLPFTLCTLYLSCLFSMSWIKRCTDVLGLCPFGTFMKVYAPSKYVFHPISFLLFEPRFN